MDLARICRTCLATEDDMRDVFILNDLGFSISTMLESFTRTQVNLGDGLPIHICHACFKSVKEAFCFKLQAEKAEAKLREYVTEGKQKARKALNAVTKSKTRTLEDDVKVELCDVKVDTEDLSDDESKDINITADDLQIDDSDYFNDVDSNENKPDENTDHLYTNTGKNGIEFSKSVKGGDMMIYQGHQYVKLRKTQSGVMIWRCRRYKSSKKHGSRCRSLIRTLGRKVVAGPYAHSHEPNHLAIRAHNILNKMKHAIKSTDTTPQSVIKRYMSSLSEDVKVHLPQRSSIQRVLSRIRQNKQKYLTSELIEEEWIES